MSFRESDRGAVLGGGCATPRTRLNWEPKIGSRVTVVGGQSAYDLKFVGKIGEVIKNRGFGVFEIMFDDGQIGKIKSGFLKEAES